MQKIINLLFLILLTGCFYVDEIDPENVVINKPEGPYVIVSPVAGNQYWDMQYKLTYDLQRLNLQEVYTTAIYYGKNDTHNNLVNDDWRVPGVFSIPRITIKSNKMYNASNEREEKDTSSIPQTLIGIDGQAKLDKELRELEQEALQNKDIVRSFTQKSAFSKSSTPVSYVLGSEKSFRILNPSTESLKTKTTRCLYVSTHSYIFVDVSDLENFSVELAQDYGDYFDSIYELMTERFGERFFYNNDKIIIVFSREINAGVLGYYYSGHHYPAYPPFPYTYSDNADVFFITGEQYRHEGIVAKSVIKGTIAHEYQHLIFYNEKRKRRGGNVIVFESWINEALSQAAEYYVGHFLNHKAWMSWGFLQGNRRGASLTNWTTNNYGNGGIYIRYLIDQYGENVTRKIVQTDAWPIPAIEAATGDDFDDIFLNFSKALVVSGRIPKGSKFYNPRNNFTTLDLTSPYSDADNLREDGTIDTEKAGHVGKLFPRAYKELGYKLPISPIHYSIRFIKWEGVFGHLKHDTEYYGLYVPRLDSTRATTYVFNAGGYE